VTNAPPPTTVFVVDDEPGIRATLARFLTRLGYRAIEAEHGAQALERQVTERPAAMLCDVLMPEVTGVELVPKALAHDPDVAIIMLTAVDRPATAIECLRLGARDYLLKPVDLDELRISLEAALRLRQLEIERRDLERWLAAEVAGRTHALEERLAAVEGVALDLLAAAPGSRLAETAVERLAQALGTTADAIRAEIARRR
jgi:DNA-binding NtrC family response regulator